MFEQLFDNLVRLCTEHSDLGFMYTDQTYTDSHVYRIFSYRQGGSYTKWLLPDAMNCRGTMFRLENDEWKLVCLPMPKCFRLNENPIIQEQSLNFSLLKSFMKFDGSLINTFVDAHDNLCVKSHASLHSPHARLGQLLLNERIKGCEIDIERFKQFTYSYELTSDNPDFRIVVRYDKQQLNPLNFRCMKTGKVTNIEEPLIQEATLTEICDYVSTMEQVEGLIVHDEQNDVYFKIKTDWYDTLHASKFSFSHKNVVSMFLQNNIDDYISIHADDTGLINKVNDIVNQISPVYNEILSNVDSFFTDYQHYLRKDFALLANKQFGNRPEFCILMEKYKNTLTNEFIIKQLHQTLFNTIK